MFIRFRIDYTHNDTFTCCAFHFSSQCCCSSSGAGMWMSHPITLLLLFFLLLHLKFRLKYKADMLLPLCSPFFFTFACAYTPHREQGQEQSARDGQKNKTQVSQEKTKLGAILSSQHHYRESFFFFFLPPELMQHRGPVWNIPYYPQTIWTLFWVHWGLGRNWEYVQYI